MPEVGTIEGYILKTHTEFEVNRLNRTGDFMSTSLEKVVSRKTQLKLLCLLFLHKIFFVSSWNINKKNCKKIDTKNIFFMKPKKNARNLGL